MFCLTSVSELWVMLVYYQDKLCGQLLMGWCLCMLILNVGVIQSEYDSPLRDLPSCSSIYTSPCRTYPHNPWLTFAEAWLFRKNAVLPCIEGLLPSDVSNVIIFFLEMSHINKGQRSFDISAKPPPSCCAYCQKTFSFIREQLCQVFLTKNEYQSKLVWL